MVYTVLPVNQWGIGRACSRAARGCAGVTWNSQAVTR